MSENEGKSEAPDGGLRCNDLLGDMSRDEKALLYTVGICSRMVEEGILEGGKHRLSAHGAGIFRALEDSGFKPTKDEIERAMTILQSDDA